MNPTLEARDLIESHWKASGNIVATSDLHGYHKNLASGSSNWTSKAGCRNYLNEVEMTNCCIDNINAVAGENDLLIHLGDWSFGGPQNIGRTRSAIKCKTIVNLFGNHDLHLEKSDEEQRLFTFCLYSVKFRINGILYHCYHHPIDKEWDEANKGSIHLFGHRHTMNQMFFGRSLDIGLDSNGDRPYKLEELNEMMIRIPIDRNHHNHE